MNGIINIYKEKGFTSADVVAIVRGKLRTRKVGHTGTLDPMACGVLPVCVGSATKLVNFMTEKTKCYRAVMRLGLTTDTEDITGKVTSVNKEAVTPEKIREVMAQFTGKLLQVPPMFSAKKVNGQKLYSLARKGIEIEREPCPVEIFSLTPECISYPLVCFTVHCSKGTYIRSLCRDIGQSLGTGAVMESLTRLSVAFLHEKDAIPVSGLSREAIENDPPWFYPVEDVFRGTGRIQVWDEEGEKRLKNGNELPKDLVMKQEDEKSLGEPMFEGMKGLSRIYDRAGVFYGVYRFRKEDACYVPEKLFFPDR